MDRAHRIGQTRPVLVLRLCTSDSVEVKLLRRAASKLALERLVIKKGAFQGAFADENAKVSLSAQDILDVLRGDLRLEV
jgi:ATP-dependent DNA helicase